MISMDKSGDINMRKITVKGPTAILVVNTDYIFIIEVERYESDWL